MHLAHLPVLRCPLCASSLTLASAIEMRDEVLGWGLLACGCREPLAVLDGVLLAVHAMDPRGVEARARLEAGRDGVEAWLAEVRVGWSLGLPPLAPRGTGLRAIADAGGGAGYEYFAWKWATRSFATGVTLLGAAPGGLFVDVGCGLGHLSYARTRLSPGTRIVAMDNCLTFLQAGRALGLLPPPAGAALVCGDANLGLPVADGAAAAMLISDGLHYLFRPSRVLADARRVLGDTGVLVLNHLHNADATTNEPAQGRSLAVPRWAGLVDSAGFAHQAVHSDDALIASIGGDGALPPGSPPESLRAERSVSILASAQAVDGCSAGVLPDDGAALALNPIYGFEPATRLSARRRWPSPTFAAEHASPLFPEAVAWNAAPTTDERRALIARLTWIAVPHGYVGPDQLVEAGC